MLSDGLFCTCSFERDRRDVFQITGTDVGELESVVIKHDNSGARAPCYARLMG